MNKKNKQVERQQSSFSYIIIIPTVIVFFILLQTIYPDFVSIASRLGISSIVQTYPEFISQDGYIFALNFIEWFGVFYGFLLPLLLIKTWERFGEIDRQFQLESAEVKILLESISLLGTEFTKLKISLLTNLSYYIRHMMEMYITESSNAKIKLDGDGILKKIRLELSSLAIKTQEESSTTNKLPFILEILQQLNDVIRIRENRISLSGQRMFQSFRLLALLTSLLFLVPFYFIDFGLNTDLFSQFLILGVTFLIIFILTIIEDLDEPFAGYWRIDIHALVYLEEDLSYSLDSLKEELEVSAGRSKKTTQKKSNKMIKPN